MERKLLGVGEIISVDFGSQLLIIYILHSLYSVFGISRFGI